MDFKDKVIAILNERSFEINDGASNLNVVDATDFDQIALDLTELLSRDYSFDPDSKNSSDS